MWFLTELFSLDFRDRTFQQEQRLCCRNPGIELVCFLCSRFLQDNFEITLLTLSEKLPPKIL